MLPNGCAPRAPHRPPLDSLVYQRHLHTLTRIRAKHSDHVAGWANTSTPTAMTSQISPLWTWKYWTGAISIKKPWSSRETINYGINVKEWRGKRAKKPREIYVVAFFISCLENKYRWEKPRGWKCYWLKQSLKCAFDYNANECNVCHEISIIKLK